MSEQQRAPVDLTDCDREPIHTPGAIQPHGALLVLREPELTILQASANVTDIVRLPLERVLQQPLALVIGDAATAVQRALRRERVEDDAPLALDVAGARFDGTLHRHGGVAMLELEPDRGDRNAATGHHPLRPAVVQLQSAETVAKLCNLVVGEVQRLTGFERVMIYRFAKDGHGIVEAEVRGASLEPYLGLRYPASDIPLPARQLYLRNWIRTIADAGYTPVPLVPALRPDTGAPLDLTPCGLRSVSPIHLEYLANMGVRASMSVSLIVDGQLWGLIACVHHSRPLLPSHAVRSSCELIGRLMSMQLAALQDRETASRRAAREPLMQKLAASMRAGDDVLHGLLACGSELCSLFAATGIAVHSNGRAAGTGQTLPEQALARLIEHVEATPRDTIFVTDSIAAQLPELEPFKEIASGVLSFALPGPVRRRLFAFRPEILQTVDWAGDPRKPAEPGAPLRLHPRHSFALWREQLRLHSADFGAGEVEAAADLRRLAVEVDLGKQVEREQRAVRLRDDLVAIVSHDLRNPLGVIQMQAALLRQLGEGDRLSHSQRLHASVERIQRSVDRMNALVRDLLDLSRIEAGRFELQCEREPIQDMVEEALIVLRPLAEAKRIALIEHIAQNAMIRADRERFFQLLSNLVGNAIKFTPERGRVLLRAEVDGRKLSMAVEDSGPGIPSEQAEHVFNRYWHAPESAKTGTGLGLYIAKGIVEAHGGEIWLERSNEGGAAFKFTLPIA